MNIISKRILQLFYATTSILGKKRNDIFLVSFPKSGNTWVKFLLLNILYINNELDENISFKVLDETIPELGRNNLMKKWKFKSLPRFIKSHRSYMSFFFGNNKAILIIREPKDVMVSFYYYVKNSYGYNFEGSFSEFIRHKKFGLEACMLHQISWQNHSSEFVKFEDLKHDKANALLMALQKLGIEIGSETFEKAYDSSSFDKMKKLEKTEKKYDVHKPEYSFARKGTSKQWTGYFDDSDISYYHELLIKYRDSYINYYGEE